MAFITNEIQKNWKGLAWNSAAFVAVPPPNDTLTPTTVIDFGTVALLGVNPLEVSAEYAVTLSSSTEFKNMYGWVSMTDFHGAIDIKGINEAPLSKALVAATTSYDIVNTIFLPGTLQESQTGNATHALPVPWYAGEDRCETVRMQIGITEALYLPYLGYDNAKELAACNYQQPFGYFCLYGQYDDYVRRYDLPQGFSDIFALLPAWEVNIVNAQGVERSLGKLEDGVDLNLSVTTIDNKSGYPNFTQSIAIKERTSEISGNLSDLDPGLFAILNDYDITTLTDAAGTTDLGHLINMRNTSTDFTKYGIVMRGWYQNDTLIEFRFDECVCYVNGSVTVHNNATRVPFTIQPVGCAGNLFIAGNKGLLAKIPMTVKITVL